MKRQKNKSTVSVKVTFTDGYEKRFTQAVLRLFEKRIQKEEMQRVAG